jgi:hypothetical protein
LPAMCINIGIFILLQQLAIMCSFTLRDKVSPLLRRNWTLDGAVKRVMSQSWHQVFTSETFAQVLGAFATNPSALVTLAFQRG